MPRPKLRSTREKKPRKRAAENGWLRPQSVVFTLLAEHLLGQERAVFSGSFIEALGKVGIGEHAVRSTLMRMTRRGLLAPEKRGRKIYLRMTARCAAVLEDGRRRIWATGAVNVSSGEKWTLLTFSLPDAWRRKRYELRARLGWSGFGPLQNGAWLAPAEVDVRPIVEQLGLHSHVRAFHIQPVAPTDASAVIRETFDLDALAERYRAFIAAWQPLAERPQPDPLELTLRLSTQWLQIIREDPRVPVHLLPADWPAIPAQRLFRLLHGTHREASEAAARALLDTIAVDSGP